MKIEGMEFDLLKHKERLGKITSEIGELVSKNLVEMKEDNVSQEEAFILFTMAMHQIYHTLEDVLADMNISIICRERMEDILRDLPAGNA